MFFNGSSSDHALGHLCYCAIGKIIKGWSCTIRVSHISGCSGAYSLGLPSHFHFIWHWIKVFPFPFHIAVQYSDLFCGLMSFVACIFCVHWCSCVWCRSVHGKQFFYRGKFEANVIMFCSLLFIAQAFSSLILRLMPKPLSLTFRWKT